MMGCMSGPKIVYTTLNKPLEFIEKDHESLLEALLANDIAIDHTCEGMASCGTCRVLVTSSLQDLPPPNSLEQDMISDRGFENNERLACQLCPKRDLSFYLPSDPKSEQ